MKYMVYCSPTIVRSLANMFRIWFPNTIVAEGTYSVWVFTDTPLDTQGAFGAYRLPLWIQRDIRQVTI